MTKKSILIRTSTTFCLIVLLAGCKSGASDQAEVKDLIVDRTAKNVALLVSGLNKSDDDREWSQHAVAKLKNALDGIRGSAPVEVREHHDVKSEDLLKMTTKAAEDVGENGTLIWYIGTHGWNDGFSTAVGARVRPAMITEALRKGRTKPLKRLILLFDYCGSGGMVEGLSLTGDGEGAPTLGNAPLRDLSQDSAPDALIAAFVDALSGASQGYGLDDDAATPTFPLYRTALYFAPVTRLQTTSGATFTEAMADTITANAANRAFKIEQFLKATVAKIGETTTSEYPNDDNDHVDKPQKAVFRALPDAAFLQETLFTAAP